MGVINEVVICCSFAEKQKQSCRKRELRLIRNAPGGENNDGCYEVEEVVIDQW